MIWWRYWDNRFLTTLQILSLGTQLSEGHSGYRAYSRQFLESIPYKSFADAFVFDSQILAAAARRHQRIVEVPIPTKYAQETSSISFLASVRYGLSTLLTLLK